ncbi:MAG: hypothetical protein SOU07_00490 [Bacilli bacterium]|nr:hypothetical protein [Acholeplasmataceae bacterium]MDY2901906.1 hypothetical protein [Bacilli bacterium]
MAFKEKWHSIYYRYESARSMLILAKESGYDDLFKLVDIDEENKKYFQFQRQVDFYESALCFYNFLVDYSWQIAYFSYEYVAYIKNSQIDLTEPIDKKTASAILKKLEKCITQPLDNENPLAYFSRDNDFKEIYDLIKSFFETFKNSNIRSNYNKIKHCGNFLYTESYEYTKMPFICSINIKGKDIPSDIRDIQETTSLTVSINELINFDNNILYPYLVKIIELLNQYLNPSKLVL